MWVPNRLLDWLSVSTEHVASLKEELAALKAERDAMKSDLLTTKVHADYFRVKVNQLEHERAALLDKAYGIRVPVPEVAVKASTPLPDLIAMNTFSFNDVGDEMAKTLGLPVYDN